MTVAPARCATDTDAELMRQVASGDARAFEAIYDRHHVRAYSLARRITGNTAGAEEATQDAFVSLWRAASSFDPERASLATWLLGLVRYRSIDWVRRDSSRTLHRGLAEDAAESIEAPERTEQQVIARQEHDQALRLVAALPPEQREVIDLAYFAGYTQMQIAAKAGIPLGTVKGRVRLALEKLRHAAESDSALIRSTPPTGQRSAHPAWDSQPSPPQERKALHA